MQVREAIPLITSNQILLLPQPSPLHRSFSRNLFLFALSLIFLHINANSFSLALPFTELVPRGVLVVTKV